MIIVSAASCRGADPPAAPLPSPPLDAPPALATAPRPPTGAPGPPSAPPEEAPTTPNAERLAAYRAGRAKSILELQLFRREHRVPLAGGAGAATLVEIQPRINDWMLLTLDWGAGSEVESYHLENPVPARRRVALDEAFAGGLVVLEGGGRTTCSLWSGPGQGALAAARASGVSFAPLCHGRLALRNPTDGRKTTLEWTTDFLRDRIKGGEKITTLVRQTVFQDAFLVTSDLEPGSPADLRRHLRPPDAPLRPAVDPRQESTWLSAAELGLPFVADPDDGTRLLAGRWYPLAALEGAYVSAFQARLVTPELVAAIRGRLNALDEVEAGALVYLVAFDLDRLTLGFALGTDHPRLGWSDRVPASVRDDRLPGPDGVGASAPLVRAGRVPPARRGATVATFTGGFKRSHGAFRAGDLALANGGSHYGFLEHGAVLSKLQPGLATLFVTRDGAVGLKTWTAEDEAERLADLRHARQNGVPLVEPGADGVPQPGGLVANWTLGNWSGSVDKRLRALRAGVCLQESEAGRFLLYGYFSSATPSAMARVFLAYGCRYAMLTDMNALEHTYLAVYRRGDDELGVDHLIRGMEVLDQSSSGRPVPRFLGFADNRDFFYVMLRELEDPS